MQDTKFRTITIPLTPDFSPLIDAGTVPLRVIVRNLDAANTVNLFLTTADAAQGVGGSTYRLPAGASDVFVLQRGQKMWAGASTAPVVVTLTSSEAVPISFSK